MFPSVNNTRLCYVFDVIQLIFSRLTDLRAETVDYLHFRRKCLLIFAFKLIANVRQIYFAAADDNSDQVAIAGSQSDHFIIEAFSEVSRPIFRTRYCLFFFKERK